MLIRFRFANHLSFRDEQELSLVASSLKEPSESVVPMERLQIGLLRALAIYGANASGKSNVLSALDFMRGAVVNSHRIWDPKGPIPRTPFALDPKGAAAPSLFETDFLLSDVRYQYGFVVDSERVLEEWLYAHPLGRRQSWFTRTAESEPQFKFGKHLTGENRSIESLTRANSLFLSAAAQNNHQLLSPIFRWFADDVGIAHEGNRSMRVSYTASMAKDEEHARKLTTILKSADLGIVGLEVKEVKLPEGTHDKVEAMKRILDLSADTEVPDALQRIYFSHRSEGGESVVPLPFEVESNGTRALFALLGPVIDALESGALLCIDELDTSIHPNLALELVNMFNDPLRNPNAAQLIFNTHDTTLLGPTSMGKQVLRRDQVWFTEKDRKGESHLYPLADYKPRKNENLGRGYLQGRYGAIPFITGSGRFPTAEAKKS
jgi:AAA15 family ATPase/GTPase